MSGTGHALREKLLATLLLFCGCALGQGPLVDGRIRLPIQDDTDLEFVPVPFGNGSSHSTVTQIAEDRSGFLWFGTKDGLRRYDGYRFREFRPENGNPQSVSGLEVESLLNDRSGNLWVASDLAVDRFNPATESFGHFPPDPSVLDGPIHHINQDRVGMIWLSTAHGLTRIDPATGRMTRYLNPLTNVLRSTFEQKDGTFWVADKESVEVFDRFSGDITDRIPLRSSEEARHGRSANLNVSLFEDHAGVVWVASQRDGLARLDRQSNRLTYFALAGVDSRVEPGVWALHEDEEGVLWVGTDGGGLLKLDRDRKRFVRYRSNPDDANSLSADHVLALFQDREGSLWVGTDGGGVVRFPIRPSFHRYRRPPDGGRGLTTSHSAYQDSGGNIWSGSEGGVNRIDGKTGQFSWHALDGPPCAECAEGNRGLSNANVIAIAEDTSGRQWFGVWGGGLHRFDPRTGQWKAFRHNQDDPASLNHDSVFALLVDHAGRLWVGTETGLNVFDPKTEHFRVYSVPGIGTMRVRAMAEDSQGVLWLATLYNGVLRFDPGTGQFTVYRHSETAGSLSSDAVAAICVDRSGAVWAGTANGLNRLDAASGKFTAYYERDGLSGNNVKGVQEDQRGDLWMVTNNGLSRFYRASGTFRNYYQSDGIPGDLISVWKGRTGDMFVGSYNGLIRFVPDRVKATEYAPPVVLTGFQLGDQPARIGGDSPLKQSISHTDSLVLSHQQRIFSFEFAALSFANPSLTRYRYKLEGLESGWNEVDATERSVRYTTLSPRDYVFRVQSRTNRGAWNEKGASIRIRILPPWWDTWPFRAVSALVFCLALWAAYRLRVRQMVGRLNLRFQERMIERTRIAGDLHDGLLQGFLSASMQLDVAADQVPPDSPLKARLNHILELMSRVSAEGRGALQGLRSPDGDSLHLEQAFAQIEGEFVPPATRSPVELRVAVEGRSRPLHPVFRDEVYRLGREAIVNAFRHSGARTIEVEIEYSRKQFSLIVSDNGCGIDPQVLRSGREGHWGLHGMRERSERVGGKLHVLSRVGRGTRIEVLAPGKVAFQLPPQRDSSQCSDLFWRWGSLKFLKRPPWLLFDTGKVVPEDSDKR